MGQPDKYSAGSKVRQNTRVTIGTVGQEFQSIAMVGFNKLLSEIPVMYTVQIREKLLFFKI